VVLLVLKIFFDKKFKLLIFCLFLNHSKDLIKTVFNPFKVDNSEKTLLLYCVLLSILLKIVNQLILKIKLLELLYSLKNDEKTTVDLDKYLLLLI
jgi:hypothetical protein